MSGRRHSRSEEGRAYQGLYKTAAWKELRLRVFIRDCYVCSFCSRGTNHEAGPQQAIAHHKVEHKGDKRLFFDMKNLATSCKACHDSIAQKESRSGFRGASEDGWPR